jgi:hypothetical protein
MLPLRASSYCCVYCRPRHYICTLPCNCGVTLLSKDVGWCVVKTSWCWGGPCRDNFSNGCQGTAQRVMWYDMYCGPRDTYHYAANYFHAPTVTRRQPEMWRRKICLRCGRYARERLISCTSRWQFELEVSAFYCEKSSETTKDGVECAGSCAQKV